MSFSLATTCLVINWWMKIISKNRHANDMLISKGQKFVNRN